MPAQKKSEISRAVKRALSAAVAALLFCCALSSPGRGVAAESYVYEAGSARVVDAGADGASSVYHLTDTSALSLVASDGVTELYFDDTTKSVAVKETTSGKMWYSLPPLRGAEDANLSAAVLRAEVYAGGTTYILNSQDNSVALGSAKSEKTENGVRVNYTLTMGDISFALSVSYYLKDSSFYASLDCGGVVNKRGAVLARVSLLEDFGSGSEPLPGDFMLVPDGPGALIDLGVKDENFEPFSARVYGGDAAVGGAADPAAAPCAVMPVFGIKSGDDAFVALVEKGDSLATVKADRAGRGGSAFNRVYAGFDITPVMSTGYRDLKTGKEMRADYPAAAPYNSELRICYRFLTGSISDYNGMAISCREQLIRNGALSTKQTQAEEHLPMNVCLAGCAAVDYDIAGVHVRDTRPLTSFEEAEDIVEQMRGKGINNINLRYGGIFDGGINQNDIAGADIAGAIGGGSGYKKLAAYMESGKLGLYPDINLLKCGSGPVLNGKDAAGNPAGGFAYVKENTVFPGSRWATHYSSLRSPAALSGAVTAFLKNHGQTKMTGLCVADAGRMVYSDRFCQSDREGSVKNIKDMIEPLAVNRKIMVDTGNLYALKQASVVVNMPLTVGRAESDAYRSVPFLQMVLHGMLDYSGTPINLSGDYETAMLRYIEYGACPSFEWIYKDLGGETGKKLYYVNWLSEAADYYELASATLSDLRSVRMTGHYKVSDDLYCTEYGGRTLIYVNYGSAPATANGIQIPPRSWKRIG